MWEILGGVWGTKSQVWTGGRKTVLMSSDKRPRTGIACTGNRFLRHWCDHKQFPHECMEKCSVDLGSSLPSSFVLLFKQLVLSDYQRSEKMGDKSVSQIVPKRISQFRV